MILETNKKRWLKVNEYLNENSGIYILTRFDENGFKYCYVGQAKKILTRLAQHLMGYQHIDLSLKKHGLYNEDKNPYGWRVSIVECSESELDSEEQKYIKIYANNGYQLRNKTSGSQSVGKVGIDDNKPSKGYHDGLHQGYANCLKDIKEYFEKYLDYTTKSTNECFKKDGTIKEIYLRKYNEFKGIIENEKKQEETDNT